MPSTTDGWSRSSTGSHWVFTAHELEKPDNDDREYRLIRLPNQLEALLIQDATTDKASAALDVHVGNLSDPNHLEGLAHFCEHLLFMGTTKYPKENDYFQYCSEHSGHSNAYTDSEHTNFYFEVSADYLEGALDRFAQFFICPLFNESCTERELKAVDSEHKKNLQTDGWRLHELEKSLTNPNHPYRKFGTGNLRTLKHNPEELGLNIREELLRFHDTYYSANIMKLCVLGKESLDDLAEWVLDKFQHVPNKNIKIPVFEGHPLTESELMKQVFVMPVKDYRSLDLTFPFPYQHSYFRIQPGHYLSHLLGHEGAGSILCFLKKKGWANYLSSGPIPGGINFDFFKVSIDLTEDGLDHYEDVVATVFQYIRMMKKVGVRESIFREVQSLAQLSFKFRENFPPSQYTSRLVEQMHQTYPREWVISGSSLFREYDPHVIQENLEWLREDGFRMTISTRNLPNGIVLTKREKWYDTEYEEMPILQSVIDAINRMPHIEELHYPGINEFVPTNFETHRLQVDQKQAKPNLIRETSTLRLWHKKDDTFWVPRTNMWILFRNPLADATPAHSVMTSLYADLLVDSLNVYAYDAEVAGLIYYVDEHTGGILLDLGGYNQKMPLLLKKVVSQMKNFEVDPARFKLIKEQLKRSYKNFALEPPYQHALYSLSYIIHEKLWTPEEKLLELESISAQDIQTYYPTILSHLHMEALVHGNAFAEEAIDMMEMVEDIIKPRAVLPSQLAGPRTLQLPEGSRYVYTRKVPDESNVNSAIEYFIQICDVMDVPLRARLSLVAQIMQEPCFDQLRTKEQLGYLVFSGVRKHVGCMGLRFIIQSEKDTIYLENRIEAFLDYLKELIEKLTDEEYQAHVNSLIADKMEKDKNMGQEGIRYWSEIQFGYFDFEQVEKDVAELRVTSKISLSDFFNTYVHPSSPKVRKISSHIQSQKQPTNIKPKINIESLYVCLTSQGVTRFNLSDLKTTVENCESGASTEEVLRKLLIDETKADENEIEMLISRLVGIMRIDSDGNSGTLVSVTPPTSNGGLKQDINNQNISFTKRDHTRMPAGNIEIEDLIAFKSGMELTAAAVPVRPRPKL